MAASHPATTNADAAPFTLRHGMVLLAAGLLVACAVLFFLSASLLLPPLARDLGVGLGQVMLFSSINFVVAALVMSFGGPFITRVIGTRRLVLFGGLLAAASFFAVSFVTGPALLYLLAVVSGATFLAATQMAGTLLVDDWFHANKGLAMGVMQGLGGIGGIVAGWVLPFALQAGGWQFGFRVTAAIVGGIAVLSGVLLVRSRPADVGLLPYGAVPHEDAEPILAEMVDAVHAEVAGRAPAAQPVATPGPAPADALRSPRFAALVGAVLIANMINAVQQHFVPLLEDNGLDLTSAGSLISVLAIASVAATLLLGTLLDRWGALPTSLLMMALFAAALLVYLTTTGYGFQLLGMLLLVTPSVLSPIATPVIVRSVFGARAFTALIGIGLAAMPLGVAIGSPLWGLAHDLHGNYDVALMIGAGLALLAGLLFAYTLRGQRQPA